MFVYEGFEGKWLIDVCFIILGSLGRKNNFYDLVEVINESSEFM